jgi:hypothetical protein
MVRASAEDEVAVIADSLPPEVASGDTVRDEGEDSYDDALLDQLHRTSQEIRIARHRLRLLLAYARDFQGRRPYALSWLAEAARMSSSGIRTAYDSEDSQRVAEILGVPSPASGPGHRAFALGERAHRV